MKYTVRYAHLESTTLEKGDIVRNGDCVGVMGNTGESTGKHLHIDCVEGLHDKLWKLSDIDNGKKKSAIGQLNYFIDESLFNNNYVITTYYCDPNYINNKIHYGYDIVGYTDYIFWNRSKNGQVQEVGKDDAYGIFVLIGFEA